MDLRKKLNHPLVKASLIYTLTDAINKAVPLLILPLLSFYLLPSDYGIVANYTVLVSVVSIFVIMGVDSAIAVNYYKLSKEELAKYIFNGVVIIGVLGAILLLMIGLFNSVIYSFVNIPLPYQALSVVMALASALSGINLSLWRLEEKPLKFGGYKISQTVLDLGVSLILITLFNFGWLGRINGMLAGSLTFGILSLILIYRRGYLKIEFSRKFVIAIAAFGLPLIPHSLSFWLRSGVDRVLITKLIGVSATGLYATGFQFGVMVSFITIAFNNAFVPYMYKLLSEENKSKLVNNLNLLKKMIIVGILVLVVLCILFTVFSNIILHNFFSESYQDASEFIFWAILSQTFQGMYLFFVNYIFYAKKTTGLAIITFACAVIQVFMSYLMIIKVGAIGAAYATALVSFINFIAVAWYSNKVFPMHWFKKIEL